MMESKTELRKALYAKRSEVMRTSPDTVRALADVLENWLGEAGAQCVGIYFPFRDEPDVRDAVTKWVAAGHGRSAAVPVVDDAKTGRMHYTLWTPGQATVSGAFGIEVPALDRPVVPDVIISPCVGVTRTGYRIGNGGGFFDRYLESLIRAGVTPVTVALAYECLFVENFVPDSFDRPFDFILTEKGCRARNQDESNTRS